MTREEMCVKFCERLPDGTLSASVNNGFDAMLLFQQRQYAFDNLAMHGLNVFDKSGGVSCGVDDPRIKEPSGLPWGNIPTPWSGGIISEHVKL